MPRTQRDTITERTTERSTSGYSSSRASAECCFESLRRLSARRSESVMRSFREIVHRAAPDGREASLVRAMGIEVVRYLERGGIPVGLPPLADPS